MVFRSFEEFCVGSANVQIAPDASLALACEMMSDARVNALSVYGSDDIAGVITEYDILRHVSQNGGLDQVHVADLMRSLTS